LRCNRPLETIVNVPDGQAPFYERHRWKAVAAVVALLGAVWALTGAPTPWKLVSNLAATEVPASNTMLVLDASRSMARPFGQKTTKLEAAQQAVERFTVPVKNEGLALRAFGGSCKESGRVLVDFGAEHGDDVRDAIAEQRPRGRSNLVNAVRAAIDDFADVDRGPRRVVIFAGSVDECAGSHGARDIRDDVEHSGVDATFKFVGLKLSRNGRRHLLAFKKGLGRRAEIAFVDTESDLSGVEAWLGDEEPGTSECADGIDNDGDLRVDEDDPECATGNTEAPEEPVGECADGVDNDGDLRVDEDDPECATGDAEAPEEPVGECADGIDNDGDLQVDENDPGCLTSGSEASG
jgi:hypothetical protein